MNKSAIKKAVSPPGEIVKQIVREVSLVDRAANGETEMIEIKDDGDFAPVEGFGPSKELCKELIGSGLVSAAQLFHADLDETGDSKEPEQLQKNLNAAAFELVQASVNFEKALSEVIPEQAEETELEKAGVPKSTQRPQVFKFLKGVMDSMKDLLKKAGFASDDDVAGANVVESTAPEKTKIKKGEETPMAITKEEMDALGEVVATAVSKALAEASKPEPQAPASTPDDAKLAGLEKSIAALAEVIKTETEQGTTKTELEKQAGQVNTQGSKLDQLIEQVSGLAGTMTQLKKSRIDGLSQSPEVPLKIEQMTDQQIMFIAQKAALGGHNPLGSAANDFEGRVGLNQPQQ